MPTIFAAVAGELAGVTGALEVDLQGDGRPAPRGRERRAVIAAGMRLGEQHAKQDAGYEALPKRARRKTRTGSTRENAPPRGPARRRCRCARAALDERTRSHERLRHERARLVNRLFELRDLRSGCARG